jgi:hypothetical protein
MLSREDITRMAGPLLRLMAVTIFGTAALSAKDSKSPEL